MMLYSVSDPAVPAASALGDDGALAQRHQPILYIDQNEPAPPLVTGYEVRREPTGGAVITYAIWHDWDIQHLYDLEHVWVHLDASGAPCRVEGTQHGKRVAMDAGSGLPQMRGPRPVLYCAAGKHAIWSDPQAMSAQAGDAIRDACGRDAGAEGIHTGNCFATAGAYTATPRDHRLAGLAMRKAAFLPDFSFREAERPPLVPWLALQDWIPLRMQALIAALPDRVPHLAALFLDCGDTLIDETTEVKIDGTEIVTAAEEIPHAMDAVRRLHALGYPMALVADGPRASFENLLKPRGIWDLLQAHVISGDVGELKPSPRMFAAAMAALGLPDAARDRVVMVGNNLSRDILGANRFGLKSLFVSWSKKRSQTPASPDEQPDRQIATLDALVGAIDAFEMALPERRHD